MFAALMFLMFQAIYSWAKPLMDLFGAGQEYVGSGIESLMDPGPFRSLLVDGLVRGVGGVLVFLPQIAILFAFIAVLEDCGYMARAAFLMDKLMSRCGLSGKSFIPLLSSVACAIPGIMGARVIENRRDRFATILVAPLMSCSARLPVYMLLIGAFLSPAQGYSWWVPGLTLFAMYAIGFIVAPLIAFLLKSTLLRGETPAFVMEMPLYKMPSLRTVLHRTFESGWMFVRRAGTIILASMIIVWALLYFPSTAPSGESYEALIGEQKEKNEKAEKKEEGEERVKKLQQEWKAQSILGRVGRAIEPAVEPLGWDWRIGVAVLASFPAREVIVGVLGIIYGQGEVDTEEIREAGLGGQSELGSRLAQEATFSVPVALSVMVFFALCCQCASTLAVIRRETNSWRWPAFTFVYMTGLAYVASLVVFQTAKWLA